jgi:hypothetical protein
VLTSLGGVLERLLCKGTVGRSLASELTEWTMVTMLFDFVHLEVWSFHCGLESPFLQEVDVGLGSATLVSLVGSDGNLRKTLESRHVEW